MFPKRFLPTLAAVVGLSVAAAGPGAPRIDALGMPDCYSYDGYKHDNTLWPDDHIHGQGSPGGPPEYWEFEESTNWLSDTSNHPGYVNGYAHEHDHELEEGCYQGPGGE